MINQLMWYDGCFSHFQGFFQQEKNSELADA